MKRYSHAFDFAAEVVSNTPDGSDVTGAMLRTAFQNRLAHISDEEMLEACDRFDSMELETLDKLDPSKKD